MSPFFFRFIALEGYISRIGEIMTFLKFILSSSFFISTLCSANTLSVFGENNMQAVDANSPQSIRELASGVCQIYYRKDMNSGCTCFRIGKKLILTNYHCLASTHLDLHDLNKFAPSIGEPNAYLYHLIKNSSKEKIDEEFMRKFGRTDLIRPKNDLDLIEQMNATKDKLGYINFNHTIDWIIPLEESSLKLKKVVAIHLLFDYALFEVDGMKDENKILELSSTSLNKNQSLVVIGHPKESPFNKHVKIYDDSNDCKVFNEKSENHNGRTHNFKHGCDTNAGSSGSPVIDRQNKKVVGLHWSGFSESIYNRAIKMEYLKQEINQFLLKN